MLHDRGSVPTLDALFLAGERADPETVAWAERQLQVPVIDHWWQTELGWPAIATCRGLGEADGIDIETGEFLAGAPGGAMAVPLDAWAARVVQLRLRNEGNDE